MGGETAAPQKTVSFETPRGRITIRSFCTPAQLSPLSFQDAQVRFARYRPLISKKESLVRAARQPDANVTVSSTPLDDIVGFGILQYPPSDERWARVGERIMMEVSVIEVQRSWRALGISKEILRLLTDHPLKEERILYMVGYSWTWDLDGKGLQAMAYRDLLIRLFSPLGFKIFQTNEPNVMLRPENLFMARVGSCVPEEVRKRFKLVRFDLDRYT